MSSKLAEAYDRLARCTGSSRGAEAAIDQYAWALREEVLTEIEDEISFLRDAYRDTIARLAFDLVEARIRRRVMDREEVDLDDADADATGEPGDGEAWSGGFAANH